MQIKEEKPQIQANLVRDIKGMEIDVVGDTQKIDSDDDIAGIMREMNDVVQKKTNFNDSINSEASTDTAFSLTAQTSDKDELLSM